MTKGEVFADVFQEDVAELFLKSDSELLEWIDEKYTCEVMDRFCLALFNRIAYKVQEEAEREREMELNLNKEESEN